MCMTKEDAKSKLERLIQALDRHTDVIERFLVADIGQDGLERDTRRLSGGSGAISASP
jgi:hypothetical protein